MNDELLEVLKKIYADSDFPVVLLDAETLRAVWSNRKAKLSRPTFMRNGTFDMPGKDDILARLARFGAVYCHLEPFPAMSDGIMLIKNDDIIIAISESGSGAANLAGRFSMDGMDFFTNIMRGGIDGIALSAQSIERMIDNDNTEVDRLFSGIRRSSYKILRNVQNATIMSKYITGSLILRKQNCNINELCGAICLAAQSVCKNPVKINLNLPYEEVITAIDIRIAERALLNILLNAMLYTRDGNEIDLTLSQTETRVMITVKDCGAGIKRENLVHVKEPYFSCEPADDGGIRPGLGLGLSIAAIFCHMHGGMLLINSEFGEGTTVAMSIKKTDIGEDTFMASIADYVTDSFSPVYIEMCDVCEIPF
jgi:hypothetical protein